MRRWDYAAAQRVDHFIAISTEIRERIARFYNRDSTIIFRLSRSTAEPASNHDDYFLIVSRLILHSGWTSRCRHAALGLPLKIAGRGRDLDRLKALAGRRSSSGLRAG